MAMADATAVVVQQVFGRLVRDGMLPRAMFENIIAAQERTADDTLLPKKAAAAREVADVARLILALSEDTITKPAFRLVQTDEPPA